MSKCFLVTSRLAHLSVIIVAVRLIDVIKTLRQFGKWMVKLDPSLEPDWDDDNVDHIAKHGIRLEQVEEVYYGEGLYPTLAVRNKVKKGKMTPYRYRLWGTDASGAFIEAIIALYPNYGLCRRVTACLMPAATRKVYLRRIKK